MAAYCYSFSVGVKIATQKVPISTLTTSYLKNTPTIISIPLSGSDDAEIGSDGDGVVDGGVDFGVGEEGNGVLEVEHLAAKLVGLGVDEDELIDGLHVCTYRAFLKSLNFYLHLPPPTPKTQNRCDRWWLLE